MSTLLNLFWNGSPSECSRKFFLELFPFSYGSIIKWDIVMKFENYKFMQRSDKIEETIMLHYLLFWRDIRKLYKPEIKIRLVEILISNYNYRA